MKAGNWDSNSAETMEMLKSRDLPKAKFEGLLKVNCWGLMMETLMF